MKVIIAAAGTAGHINPGISIARIIEKNFKNSDIRFIATGKKLEEDLISKAGYKSYKIHANGFSSKPTISNIKKNFETLKGFKEAKKILKEFKPDLVIGTGGYICASVIYEARKLKIPTMLHESNAYPGLAIRMLNKINKVDTIMLGIDEARNYLNNKCNIVFTGTPTTLDTTKLTKTKKESVYKDLKLKKDKKIVFIFGGSQGALKINNAVVDLLKHNLNEDYQIILGTGNNNYDNVIKSLNGKYKNAVIMPYIYNISDVMKVSDLIVARSGAMTLTEISLLKKPSIFIPLPSSKSNRQEDNARVFERKGASKIILNNEIEYKILDKYIKEIISDDKLLKKMGNNASLMAPKNSEDKILKEILKLIKKS